MKELFRKYSILLLLLISLLVLGACSEGGGNGDVTDDSSGVDGGVSDEVEASDDDAPTIAVVLKGSDAEYFKLAEAGAKQAFEDFGVNGKFLAASTQTKEQELINILEDLSTELPDALVLMPSTNSVVPTLKTYSDNDVPVLLIDTDLDWDEKLTYIGTDNYTAGYEAGEYLNSVLSPGDEIAIIEGVSGAAQNEARVQGAKDAVEEYGLEVVTVQAADFDRTKAVDVMENIITAHADVKGIFTANDEMALGALQAIKASGKDITVIGVDGTTDALKSISDGDLDAVIQQLPFEMAYIGVENAIRAVEDKSIDERIDSGTDLITDENAQSVLEDVNSKLGK